LYNLCGSNKYYCGHKLNCQIRCEIIKLISESDTGKNLVLKAENKLLEQKIPKYINKIFTWKLYDHDIILYIKFIYKNTVIKFNISEKIYKNDEYILNNIKRLHKYSKMCYNNNKCYILKYEFL
jgi:hypothetical protein